MRALRIKIKDGKKWIAKRKFGLTGRTATASTRQDRDRGEYSLLRQHSNDYEEWSHAAAKVYLQAWVVSWHQLNNEEAKEVALWSYEDLELIAAAKHSM